MVQALRNGKEFMAYDYKEVTVEKEQAAMYLDCYENFGWVLNEKPLPDKPTAALDPRQITLRLKRDRKILNKAELTRLQRHFEACTNEIAALEKAKSRAATIWAFSVALTGTAFMAGSTFAVVQDPPIIWLCIVLAIPGFLGWILPYFLYQKVRKRETERLQPLIEEKYEEIYGICEKGHSLL